MNRDYTIISRRQFLSHSVRGAGVLATGGALATQGSDVNPFAYDVERFRRTDPKLIGYEEASRFATSITRARRIASGGPDDHLYVAGGTGVTAFDNQGKQVQEFKLTGPARCVAVAADGTVYAGLRDHLQVFDAKGTYLASWESPGQKTWFTGLAVTENELFAADAANRVILHYDRAGKLLGKIGEKNKDRNIPGLIVPSPYLDVVLGHDGLLRVNNPGRHRVEVYTTGGDLELFWGKPSAAVEGFCGCCNPIALMIAADGRLITCEKGLPRVKVYSADGKFESVVAGPESFPENAKNGATHDPADGMLGGLDAAADQAGRIYILDLVVGDVRVMKRKA